MKASFAFFVAARAACIAVALFAGACSKAPEPLLDLKISEGDWKDYERSLETISRRQTPAERTEFEKALDELKYQALVADQQPAGREINALIRDQIGGLSVRDVLFMGNTLRLARKRDEEKALLRSIGMNQRLRTKPGDEASATFLASTRANQASQLQKLQEEIVALETRIAELGPATNAAGESPPPPADKKANRPAGPSIQGRQLRL